MCAWLLARLVPVLVRREDHGALGAEPRSLNQ